ncbi:phage holin family protein [Euzebya rosea]|uniref:phage holin family protein n=1 Tax=Euzebya rosea TaxID=2052804 RepID=UPI001300A638|nr:phage holin family protein [Euzebya rosea]
MDTDLRPPRAEESLGELAKQASQQASTLIRDEVALAKIELKQDMREAVAGISLFSAAGVTALLSVLMLSAAAGFGIGTAMGEGWTWAGFAIVGIVYLVIAGLAAVMGRKHTEEIPPPAPRTTRQVKETVAATKEIGR